MFLDHLHSFMDVTLDGIALKPFSTSLTHFFQEGCCPPITLPSSTITFVNFILSFTTTFSFGSLGKMMHLFHFMFQYFLGALLHSHGIVHQFSWWVCSYYLKIPYHIWFPRHFSNKLVYQKLLLQLVWYFLQCSSTKSFCNQPL